MNLWTDQTTFETLAWVGGFLIIFLFVLAMIFISDGRN